MEQRQYAAAHRLEAVAGLTSVLAVRLVQLKTLASINPGIASIFFALSVIFTMLAAQAFDSRMIWDVQAKDEGPKHDE